MSGFGTDVLAVTCILGGAAVSGAATLALVGERGADEATACVVEAAAVRPTVVVTSVSGTRGGTVVVTPSAAPRVRVRSVDACVLRGEVVRIDRSHAELSRELDRARAEAARVRAEAERVRASARELRAHELTRIRELTERAREDRRALTEAARAREEASRIRR